MSSKLQILVAEDNRVLADVIQFNLEDEGFDVVRLPRWRRTKGSMWFVYTSSISPLG